MRLMSLTALLLVTTAGGTPDQDHQGSAPLPLSLAVSMTVSVVALGSAGDQGLTVASPHSLLWTTLRVS